MYFRIKMTSAMDVLDILDIDESSPKKSFLDKDALLARTEKVIFCNIF